MCRAPFPSGVLPAARGAAAILVAVALAHVAAAAAEPRQQHPPADRPKIGLALGGGGAKGGAHVGVLKVLEELNIPIDYIAGTSIGAIVGGMYASGMTADELAQALQEVDWTDALTDQPNRQNLTFRRKEDTARYTVKLQLGWKDGKLKWPAGFMTGQKLYFLLQSLTIEVSDVDDFDELPIPFRCVATDIQTGDPLVLAGGNLAAAMRASMAIPVAFTPVTLQGKTLVDGGVTNNLPVDVAREMGADIVIAVDLGAPLTARQIESLLQIQAQLRRMVIRKNMEPQLEQADLVIHPDVSEHGTLDFGLLDENMRLGLEAAEAQREELERFSIDPAAYRELRERQRLVRGEPPIIGSIELRGNQRVDSRILRNQLRQRPGERFDFHRLFEDISRIYGLGDFEQVSFSVSDTEEDHVALTIHMTEKTWGPTYLNFGVLAETSFEGGLRAAVLVNVTRTRINSRGAELRADFQLGTRRVVYGEFYQPLDYRGRFFVAPNVRYNLDRVPLYEDGSPVAEVKTRFLVGELDLGYQIARYGEARVGYVWGRSKTGVGSGIVPPDSDALEKADVGAIEVDVTLDRLDNFNVPRRGFVAQYDGFFAREKLGGDDDYNRNLIRLGYWHSWGKNTVFGRTDVGGSPGDPLPLSAQYTLGGLFSLSGFQPEQLRGDYLAVGRVGYYRHISKSWFLGGFAEAGNVWLERAEVSASSLIPTGTLFLGSDTLVGPVYLAYGHAEGGVQSLYLIVGRAF